MMMIRPRSARATGKLASSAQVLALGVLFVSPALAQQASSPVSSTDAALQQQWIETNKAFENEYFEFASDIDGPSFYSQPNLQITTPLSEQLAAGQSSPEVGPKHPYSMDIRVFSSGVANLQDLPPKRARLADYVQNQLLPAVQSWYTRSIRVRQPSGVIDGVLVADALEELFGNLTTAYTPNPFEMPDEIESDLIVIASVDDVDNKGVCPEGVIASAGPTLVEAGTGRPLVSIVQFCQLRGPESFEQDLATTVHELMHGLGFLNEAFKTYIGYDPAGPGAAMQEVPLPGNETGANGTTTAVYLTTRQVQGEVRRHFACKTSIGAKLEDFGGNGTRAQHFEAAAYWKDMQRGFGASTAANSFENPRATDLTLAVLHDSGWYDVKYGSQGFSTHGYQAGCAFAEADYDRAIASPLSKDLLCERGLLDSCSVDECSDDIIASIRAAAGNGTSLQELLPIAQDMWEECLEELPMECFRCLNDRSAGGICRRELDNNPDFALEADIDSQFDFPQAVRAIFGPPNATEGTVAQIYSDECTQTPFSRCVKPSGGLPTCANMACKRGRLLINGQPCDASKYECPDVEFLCNDPGTLTCRGDLNDCSGNGDCYRGACYCRTGWGGAACDVPICTGSCAGGEPCPPSGFCGVEECGEWTDGPDDRGVPCNAPADAATSRALPPGQPLTNSPTAAALGG